MIAALKVEISDADEGNIRESFDHSIDFFKCKAYGHWGLIPKEKIVEQVVYGLNAKE